MKKSIYALTAALALASPYFTSEARAGNPFVAAQEALNRGNLEQRAEEIPVPVPQPPVAQEYPIQKTTQTPAPMPILIQGAPEIRTQPQTVYAPQIVINLQSPNPSHYYGNHVIRPGCVGVPQVRGMGIPPMGMGMGYSPMMGFPQMNMGVRVPYMHGIPPMRPGMGMPFAPGFVPGPFMGGRPGMPYPYRHY